MRGLEPSILVCYSTLDRQFSSDLQLLAQSSRTNDIAVSRRREHSITMTNKLDYSNKCVTLAEPSRFTRSRSPLLFPSCNFETSKSN